MIAHRNIQVPRTVRSRSMRSKPNRSQISGSSSDRPKTAATGMDTMTKAVARKIRSDRSAFSRAQTARNSIWASLSPPSRPSAIFQCPDRIRVVIWSLEYCFRTRRVKPAITISRHTANSLVSRFQTSMTIGSLAIEPLGSLTCRLRLSDARDARSGSTYPSDYRPSPGCRHRTDRPAPRPAGSRHCAAPRPG